MKKLLSLLCAAMLCVCCLALAACGGSSSSTSSTSSASGSASASASSSAASTTADFVGDWKLAGAETQGMTITGDFSSMMGLSGGITLSINEGGTGVATYGSDTKDFTWAELGEGKIAITMPSSEASESSASASASSASASSESASSESASSESASSAASDSSASAASGNTVEFTLTDGVLSGALESDGEQGTMLFTKDGKLPNAVEISTSAAKPITSEAELIGEWKLSGMNMMGMIAYGDSETLASLSGEGDTSIVFEQGGKCKMAGEEAKYSVGENGAEIEYNGTKIPILGLDGNILMDLGSVSGSGVELVMMYSK